MVVVAVAGNEHNTRHGLVVAAAAAAAAAGACWETETR